MAALLSYVSQYGEGGEGADLFPREAEIRERLAAIARFYGNQIGVKYGEPFVVKEAIADRRHRGHAGALAVRAVGESIVPLLGLGQRLPGCMTGPTSERMACPTSGPRDQRPRRQEAAICDAPHRRSEWLTYNRTGSSRGDPCA